jgi:hypothetical protein
LFATDIPKVLYGPHKVFKKIVENPKYLGAIIVLLIFVAVQTGFYYSFYSKSYVEQTTPDINQIGAWTSNTTLWQTSSGVAISTNNEDFLNSTNYIYGNSSLQFDASNNNRISMSLNDIDQLNCGPMGYPNMSMRIKLVQPQTGLEKVTLTLYSIGENNYFQYDLTTEFSSSAADVWNNFTLPLGAGNWQSTGDAKWENITGLKLDFTFTANVDVTVRVQGLFFRGIYQNPIEAYSTTLLLISLQQGFMSFMFEWLVFTGLLFIMLKIFKVNAVWKPLFIAVGFALIVMVVQSLINSVATFTLPQIYYPVESMNLANIAGEAQIINNVILSQASTFSTISAIVLFATYVWTAALGVFIVRALLPEFPTSKSIIVSASSLVGTIILLSLLGV